MEKNEEFSEKAIDMSKRITDMEAANEQLEAKYEKEIVMVIE